MTVRELLEILKELPQDATVMTIHELCGSDANEVNSVEIDDKYGRIILHNLLRYDFDKKRHFYGDSEMNDKNMVVMGWLEGLTQDDWGQWHSDSEVQETAKAALKVLKEQEPIVLLKEQEAKKPIYNPKKYGDYLPHCSVCEKVLPNSSQYGRAKFCHNCGQAVKW